MLANNVHFYVIYDLRTCSVGRIFEGGCYLLNQAIAVCSIMFVYIVVNVWGLLPRNNVYSLLNVVVAMFISIIH